MKTIKRSEIEREREKMHKIHAIASSKLIKACLIRSGNSKTKTFLLAELFDALKIISELSDQEEEISVID